MRLSTVLVLASLSLSCADQERASYWDVMERCSGTWSVDAADAHELAGFSVPRDSLSLSVTRTAFPDGPAYRLHTPYAWGTLGWGHETVPVAFEIGLPDDEGSGFTVFVRYDDPSRPQPFGHDAYPEGIGLRLMTDGEVFDAGDADPRSDQLLVDFDCSPLLTVEDWESRVVVSYHRTP